ncbi:hypothetical protein D9611_013776 [Ephemerocybe angulata]|uniref:Uncharacterized protein n=1 Tax=Ephemerocybe angulata TaxID=980116 RepID=A0A8H5FFG8_9AGAR|nr:hypothetical protein D9611_013776 [Tulosesus angulatus]
MSFGIGFTLGSLGKDAGAVVQVLYASLHLLLVTTGVQLFLCVYGFSVFKETAPPSVNQYSTSSLQRSTASSQALAKRKSRARYIAIGFVMFVLFLAYNTLASLYLAQVMLGAGSSETAFGDSANVAADDVELQSREVSQYEEYLGSSRGGWVSVMGMAALMSVVYLGSGVFMYRNFIAWGRQLRVIGVPFVANLGSFGLGVTMLNEMRRTSTSESTAAIGFGCAWVTLSVVANLFTSALLTYRLARPPLKTLSDIQASDPMLSSNSEAPPSVTERAGQKRVYSVVAILVESGLPVSLFGIVAAIVYSPNIGVKPASVPIVTIWACLSALAPQLLIFRIATGVSHTRAVVSEGSSDALRDKGKEKEGPIVFAPRRYGAQDSVSMPTTTFSSNAAQNSHHDINP